MVEPRDINLREVLYEFVSVGRYMRVNAIDPRTGIEVSMIADPRYGETLIKRLAARKLAYVISKRRPGLLNSQKRPLGGRGQSKDENA
tara:strand:- start:108 stop:371 length:264 start_codon:yes stop_codon:yes gene_type:complete